MCARVRVSSVFVCVCKRAQLGYRHSFAQEAGSVFPTCKFTVAAPQPSPSDDRKPRDQAGQRGGGSAREERSENGQERLLEEPPLLPRVAAQEDSRPAAGRGRGEARRWTGEEIVIKPGKCPLQWTRNTVLLPRSPPLTSVFLVKFVTIATNRAMLIVCTRSSQDSRQTPCKKVLIKIF